MAKIQTETVVITFNKLIKDNENEVALLSYEQLAALEQVAQELAGDGIVVEAQVA
jgi:hypothetical protein|tara:strand:+ start:1146 stop:1310 length:165 start_codon:yes stop_codon:yes gene_type:complete